MTQPSRPAAARLAYIDWVRGLAILIMIEAHVLDAWTLPSERHSFPWMCAAILAGFAAPTFLFLAGVSGVLAASGRTRKTGDMASAAAGVRRRGWEVFGLAFLFRLQAYILNPGAMLMGVLKVDILNVMGPSIVAAAALWQVGKRNGRRLVLLGAATLAVTLVTPLVRTASIVDWLPGPLEWYVRPVPGRNNFMFFPWMGFVLAGAFVGVLIDECRERRFDQRVFHALLGVAAIALGVGAYAGSYLPSVYPDSNFWTSSPMFFLLRVGIVTTGLCVIYFWELRPRLFKGRWAWNPMAQFGRASLFVYWVHVEIVYGRFSRPLHKALTFPEALVALAGFSLLMFALAMAKNRGVDQWKKWRKAQGTAGEIEKAGTSTRVIEGT